MNMRDLIMICESDVDFCDLASAIATQCEVEVELSGLDPDDSVWNSVAHDLASPDTAIIINDIQATTQKSGHGTKALRGICDLADRMG